MDKATEKSVPYISFSINKLLPFLGLIRRLQPIQRDLLTAEYSREFARSKKTAQEYIISLKNLGLIREANNAISLSEKASRMMLKTDESGFWEILRQDLLRTEVVSNILSAISSISRERKKVTSSEEYYKSLSNVLQTEYSFVSASPRELDRFISLFRKLKILDYDPFLGGYFLVKKRDVENRYLESISLQKYQRIKDEMLRKTGTSWVPIDQLRSEICLEEGIETEVLNKFLRSIIGTNSFQFAEASASRREVSRGGIEKNGKIYYYIKMLE